MRSSGLNNIAILNINGFNYRYIINGLAKMKL